MIPKKTGTIVLAAGAVLMIAGVIVTSMLLVTRPSIIQISDGTFRIIDLPYTYTRNDAYVLVFSSAIGGMMLAYILLILFAERSEAKSNIIVEKPVEIPAQDSTVPTHAVPVMDDSRLVEAVLTALEGDERELVKQIANNGGEILQNELVLSLNFSKVKVSRMLTNLEKRGLIIKEQYGLTNKVFLADKLRGEKTEK
jgi:hypothetical protein